MSQVTTYTIPGSPLNMVELGTSLAELFAAAASCNRGATAPASPFEGMLWWDNSANPEILKRYTVTAGWVSIVSVNITTGVMTLSGHVANSLFDANTILAANTDNTPAAVTIAEQRLVGRLTGGNIKALTAAEVATIIGSSVPPWAFLSDVKAVSVDGGTATKEAWNWRTLNTITGSSGYTSWITLTSSKMLFAVGTYFIEATAPAYAVGEHKAAIKNMSTSTYEIIGTSVKASGTYSSTTQSLVRGLLTVTNATHEYRLLHYTANAQTTNGLGLATDVGDMKCGVSEIYSTLKVTKYS